MSPPRRNWQTGRRKRLLGSDRRNQGRQALFSQPAVEVFAANDLYAWRDLEETRKRAIALEHSGQGVAADAQLIGHLLAAHKSGHGGLVHGSFLSGVLI